MVEQGWRVLHNDRCVKVRLVMGKAKENDNASLASTFLFMNICQFCIRFRLPTACYDVTP